MIQSKAIAQCLLDRFRPVKNVEFLGHLIWVLYKRIHLLVIWSEVDVVDPKC